MYQTSFAIDQNPLSESGKWFNNNTAIWKSVYTSGGVAYPSAPTTNADDAYAILNQDVVGNPDVTVIAHKPGAPGNYHEIEILLQCIEGVNSIQAYECMLGFNGNSERYAYIVRWNGPHTNYTVLASNTSIPVLNDNDKFRCTYNKANGLIRCYLNNQLIMYATDVTYAASNKVGIAFYSTDSNVTAYGIKDFYFSDQTDHVDALFCMPTDVQVYPFGTTVSPKYTSGENIEKWGISPNGKDPMCLAMIRQMNPLQYEFIRSQPDVYEFPQNLDVAIGGAESTAIKALLDPLNVPVNWVNASQTYREVARTICSQFYFANRLTRYYPSPILSEGRTLNTQWSNLSAGLQSAMMAAADSFGYNKTILSGNTTIRNIYKDFADQWGSRIAAIFNLVL